MNILLTGATGLLGAHILEVGLNAGHKFKVIVPSIPKRSFLTTVTESVEVITADLCEKNSLAPDLLNNCDCVINCAGLASIRNEDTPKMEALNIQAAKELFKLAKASGIKTWVQVSSVATMCAGVSDQPICEKNIGSFRPTSYAQTKFTIDNWLEENKDEKTNLLTIHPCYMLGKWDARPSSGSIFFALKMNKVPTLVNSIKNFVSPTDVANGIFLALSKNATGNYILGNENIKIQTFIDICCRKLAIINKQKFVSMENFNNLKLSELEKAFAEEFSFASPVSIKKAQNELGYSPLKSVEDIIDESIKYFINYKMLRVHSSTPKIHKSI